MDILLREEFGAGNETRTRDPDLGKVVLYQLSYSRLGGLCFTALSNFGAGNETRTRDPDLGKVVLYQLSYSRLGGLCFTALSNFGAGNETRTRDPDLGKVVLYQLSYSRVLLNFAFVIFAFLRRYGRRIIREIFPSATPLKNFF